MTQISNQLQKLFSDIDELIALTREDIELVKKANHERIKNNNLEKEIFIKRFERNKELLNQKLLTLTNDNPDKTLEELLSKDEQEALFEFKNRLRKLRILNRDYARFVGVLNEFFSSLAAAVIPMKSDGYIMSRPQPASFLRVSA